jgi:hypothetical protein
MRESIYLLQYCAYFGDWKRFSSNLLFTSQNSLNKHMVLSFLGMMNNGKAHSDAGCLSNTPMVGHTEQWLVRPREPPQIAHIILGMEML